MRNYEDLNPSEKLLAVLTNITKPVTVGTAMDLGGIPEMSEEEIKTVISKACIDHAVDEKFGDIYCVSALLKADVYQELDVDPNSVEMYITNKMLEDIGMGDDELGIDFN